MESFFGRLKCELLDLVALCPDASTVSRMISGYIDAYNHRHYQYALAGLTPSEYYTYVTTGIYRWTTTTASSDRTYANPGVDSRPSPRGRGEGQKVQRGQRKETRYAQGKKKDPEFVIARINASCAAK